MYVNLSAYRFVTIDQPTSLQRSLLAKCQELQLLGTVYLSTEGINLNVVGSETATTAFRDYVNTDPRFANLDYKISESAFVPFKKLVVKVRPEIITLRQATIKPEHYTVPHVAPQQLKAWLDNHEDVVLIDTRNNFEIEDYGTFQQAINLRIDRFTDFPTAITELPTEYHHKKVIIFCTGGVRCEKAGPVMNEAGFRDVHQLDGGILNYFKECGGEHYQGSCFVFDDRVAVTPQLQQA